MLYRLSYFRIAFASAKVCLFRQNTKRYGLFSAQKVDISRNKGTKKTISGSNEAFSRNFTSVKKQKNEAMRRMMKLRIRGERIISTSHKCFSESSLDKVTDVSVRGIGHLPPTPPLASEVH